MRCPKCGYNSFDHNFICPKCREDLLALRQALGLTMPEPGAVDFFALAAARRGAPPPAEYFSASVVEVSAEEMPTEELTPESGEPDQNADFIEVMEDYEDEAAVPGFSLDEKATGVVMEFVEPAPDEAPEVPEEISAPEAPRDKPLEPVEPDEVMEFVEALDAAGFIPHPEAAPAEAPAEELLGDDSDLDDDEAEALEAGAADTGPSADEAPGEDDYGEDGLGPTRGAGRLAPVHSQALAQITKALRETGDLAGEDGPAQEEAGTPTSEKPEK